MSARAGTTGKLPPLGHTDPDNMNVAISLPVLRGLAGGLVIENTGVNGGLSDCGT